MGGGGGGLLVCMYKCYHHQVREGVPESAAPMLDKRREFVPERKDSWTILPSSVRREHMPFINGADCHHIDSHLYCHIPSLVIYLAERQTFSSLKAYGPTLYIGHF